MEKVKAASVMRSLFIIGYVAIGAVIGVTVFLLMAWGEAVRISNKDR